MIKITEDKFEKASEHVEKALKAMGKVMQCFSEWEEESEMGMREGGYGNRGGQGGGSYGSRGGYGSRYGGGSMGQRGSMGYRDDEDEWDEEEEMMMRERRGVRGSGRGRGR